MIDVQFLSLTRSHKIIFSKLKMFKSIIFRCVVFLSILSCPVFGKAAHDTVKSPSTAGEYQLDKSWPHKSVSDLQVKGSSISIDSWGNIVLLHRGFQAGSKAKISLIRENTVTVIDRSSGKVLREWGSDKFLEPHGLFITQHGDIFITDKVMHQIYKFDFDNSTKLWNTEPSLTLGERFVPGYDAYHFCGPSDVVEDPATDNFFVADGYCHSRVIKFDKNGKLILQFGPGSSDPAIRPTPWNVTHALALAQRSILPHPTNTTATSDNSTIQSILMVSDRNNGRLQVFSLNGTFLYEIGSNALGCEHDDCWILGMATQPNLKYEFGQAFVIKGHVPLGEAKVILVGLNEANFTILSSFPITKTAPKKPPPAIKNGTEPVKETIKLETPHDIAVAKNGKEIYLVETLPELTLKRLVWTDIKLTGGQHGSSAKGLSANLVSEGLVISISSLLTFILSFICM